ncbi:MAG TPA: hypothetical protein G4O07_01415 [Dehalococcoidia bacterium]|nr:hypothetical protein [Dehalococcoidia bacterium]
MTLLTGKRGLRVAGTTAARRAARIFLVTGSLAAISLLLLTTGCIRIVVGGDGIVGSPTLVIEEFDFEDFTYIEAGSAFEVDITRSDTFSISVTVNENLLEYVDITQSGNTLKVLMTTQHNYRNATRHVSITLPELRKLSLLGANQCELSGFKTDQPVDFLVTGASTLELADMEAGDVDINVSGASRVLGDIKVADSDFDITAASTLEIEGEGNHMDLHVVAASTARLENFPVKTATTSIVAASNATVDVSERLDIEVSSASRLVYSGDAVLGSINVSGGSTLSHN